MIEQGTSGGCSCGVVQLNQYGEWEAICRSGGFGAPEEWDGVMGR